MNKALTESDRQQQNNRLYVTMDERNVNNPCLSFVYSTTRMNKKKLLGCSLYLDIRREQASKLKKVRRETLVCSRVNAAVVGFSFGVPFTLHLSAS